MDTKNSRLPLFYKKPLEERQTTIANWAGLSIDDLRVLNGETGFSPVQANHMIENVVGIYSLPLGIATNFYINGRDYLVPLVIEEPSVVAALSNAAKLFREGGGFFARSDEPLMIGQIQVLDVPNMAEAARAIEANKTRLLAEADAVGGSIVKRGGGARDIEVRIISDSHYPPQLILHLVYDTRDAMGANAVNTAVEHLAPSIETLTGGRVNLRILSNLTDKRKAYAEGMIPYSTLEKGNISGRDAVALIVEAGIFAEIDPYRATTHNKGIMNGIDAVVIATGNDWRAVEAGAHAFAARHGRYTSLTRWWQDDDGNLRGSIELPLAVGIVGGATKVHPTAQIALKILAVETAQELAQVMACVGLAQNLAAIRALATEGIQSGHMRMHAKQLAVAAGAEVHEVHVVTQRMIDEGIIRLERAKEHLEAIRKEAKE
jgi:hydroxymethylglutaryl-CoA reductase